VSDDAGVDAVGRPGAMHDQRDQKYEVVGFSTDMALPEIEQIHVVGDRLATLDLENDPCPTERAIPVGSQPNGVLGEQICLLARKAQRLGIRSHDGVDLMARPTDGGDRIQRDLDFGAIECRFQLLRDFPSTPEPATTLLEPRHLHERARVYDGAVQARGGPRMGRRELMDGGGSSSPLTAFMTLAP